LTEWYFDIIPALKGTKISDTVRSRRVSHYLQVSATDGIKAPFTSQTSPICPTVLYDAVIE